MRHILNTIIAATLLGLAVPRHANAQERQRSIYVNSYCKHPLQILVHHRDRGNSYHTHAWWTFEAFDESRLSSINVTLQQIEGEPLYYFAETITRPGVPYQVWGGEGLSAVTTTFNGVEYKLRRASLTVNSQGDYELTLTCT